MRPIVVRPATAAVKIEVLSSRADLVSGGNAVVAITAKRASKQPRTAVNVHLAPL